MSEPITLYDGNGNEVIRYSPAMAHLEVAAGLLFVAPPDRTIRVVSGNPDVNVSYVFDTPEDKTEFLRKVETLGDADEGMPALDGMPQDDEPKPKRGRPRKGTGVL